MNAEGDKSGGSVFLSSDRLASLSDTMFGVAMTLVATTLLPSIEAHKGSVHDHVARTTGELVSVVFSFAISAINWVSQQQRLAMTGSVTPRQTAAPSGVSVPDRSGADFNQPSCADRVRRNTECGHDLWRSSHPDRADEPVALARSFSQCRSPSTGCQVFSGARPVPGGVGSRRDAAQARAVWLDFGPCRAAAGPPHRATFGAEPDLVRRAPRKLHADQVGAARSRDHAGTRPSPPAPRTRRTERAANATGNCRRSR